MRYLFHSLISIIFIVSFVSCIDDESSIGDNLVSSNGRSIIVDTCTVKLHTQLSDSSVTSGLSRLFEGRYVSSDFGIITTHAYFDFSPPSYSTSEFGSDATVAVVFDSISLILRYDNFSYGDTTKMQTLHIYKLKEILELDDKNQLYSTSTIAAETTPWVSHQFYRPTEYHDNDTLLEVRLPDEFGLDLFRMMHARSDTLDSYDYFKRYFKGVKLSPQENENAAINSFIIDGTFPVIRIYYRTIGTSQAEKTIDLSINSSTAFSRIETDRSNTLLSSLNYKNKTLSSSETENKAYLQGLTGLYTRIDFPYLNELLKLGDYVALSQAYLYVFPALGTYNAFTPLPGELYLNYLGEDGSPMDIYVNQSTTTVQSGTLVEDKIYNENTYYAFDISSYLKQELGVLGAYKTSLQLQLTEDDKGNTLKSLVFGDSMFANENNRIQLIVYFVAYDK